MSDPIGSATLTHGPTIAQSVGIDPPGAITVRLPLEGLERSDLCNAEACVRLPPEASAASRPTWRSAACTDYALGREQALAAIRRW
jgi:hypothetical protein